MWSIGYVQAFGHCTGKGDNMSQRLIRPGLSATDTVWSRILGVSANGTVIRPVAGADDDDTDPNPDDDEESEDEEDEGESEDEAKKDKKGKKDGEDDEETVPKWKYDKLDKRMRASDKNNTDLRAKVADLEKKLSDGKDVSPELKSKIADLEPRIAKLTETNSGLRLQIAFLTTNVQGVKWRDPEAALKLVDLSDVDIEDDGTVDKRALKAALKQLAKDKPYLVVGKDDDDNGGNEDDGGTKDQRSGTSMNGKRKGTKAGAADRAALARKFPVLNRL